MLEHFPSRVQPHNVTPVKPIEECQGFWEKARAIPGTELLRLNGHRLVNGEKFWLDPQANGSLNIMKHGDNSKTGCYVRQDGSIGQDKGKNIVDWCLWYGHSLRDVAEGLKEVFEELRNEKET